VLFSGHRRASGVMTGIRGVRLGDAVDSDGERSKRWFVMLRSIG
jgi:hypothetical protein